MFGAQHVTRGETHTPRTLRCTQTLIRTNFALNKWIAWLGCDRAAVSYAVRKRRVMAVQRSLQTKQIQTTQRTHTHARKRTNIEIHTELRLSDPKTCWRQAAAMICAEEISMTSSKKLHAGEKPQWKEDRSSKNNYAPTHFSVVYCTQAKSTINQCGCVFITALRTKICLHSDIMRTCSFCGDKKKSPEKRQYLFFDEGMCLG